MYIQKHYLWLHFFKRGFEVFSPNGLCDLKKLVNKGSLKLNYVMIYGNPFHFK